MFHLTRLLQSRKVWRGDYAVRVCVLALGLGCALALYFPSPFNRRMVIAQTGTVVQNDFEDGALQGWIPRGPVTLTNTTEAAAGGTHSLKTTGRTAGFHGPSLNVLSLLTKGATYQVSASVRLVAGEAPTVIRVTMQQTPAGGGGNQFVTISSNNNMNVTDAAFVTLTGLYSFGADMSGLLLYVEAASATASYYLDNFSITKVADPPGPPPNTNGAATDFEDNTTQGWRPRIGREILTVTTADAHGGNHSLLTTGRQAAFDGPSFDVTNVMFNGSRYRVSLWVKLAPNEPNTPLKVSLQRNAGTLPATFHTVIDNTNVPAGQWVNLKTVYDVALANTSLTLYVESASGTPSFYIDDVTITFVPPPVAERDIPSVYLTLAEFFPVGAAIHQGDLTGEHAVLLTKHFNSVTSENDMKWSSLQPAEGNFDFAKADAQVNFAKANNMRIRGHTLVWHSQVPAWVFNDPSGAPMTPTPENKSLLLQRMETHIRTVVDRYKNDVYAWDVVNEVIDPSQPDGFRRSPWFNIIGPEFIDRAFQVAREVDPDARLFINDFDTTNTTKRQFLFNLVRDLKSRSIPIDGVGHQMHNNVDFPSAQAIIDTINLFDNLGVENEVTELDCSIYSGSNPPVFDDYALIPQNLFIKQGYRYQIFFDAFRALKGKIGSVTFWGQADDHTWLTSPTRVNGPLLFDTSLKKKPAYFGVIDPSQLPCGVSCPADITQTTDPGACGAVVNYPTPMVDTVCGPVTCNPPSGSFFRKGVTTVTCSTPVLSRCSFTVTVNDAEKPKITRPSDITRVIDPSCPVGTSLPVTYATPVATDNCSGVTVTCNPPSGSSFPAGMTTVNCIATDTSGNTESSSFTVSVFNVCLVDDNNPSVRLLINTVTGEYRFFSGGNVYSGRGVVIRNGCSFALLDSVAGRLLTAAVDTSLKKGAAALVISGSRQPFLITDRNLANNNCNGG